MLPLALFFVAGFFVVSFGAVKGISIVRTKLHPAPIDSYEVEGLLRRRNLWKQFDSGMIHCSECDEVVSFHNLGTLSEDEQSDDIDFICRNPKCLEFYLRKLESTMWDHEENAS